MGDTVASTDGAPEACASANLSKVLKSSHHVRTSALFAATTDCADTQVFRTFFDDLEEMSATDKNFLLAHIISMIAFLISPGALLLLLVNRRE